MAVPFPVHVAARDAARLRYDQFMALGWKLLIPVSLAWILVVAVLRTTHTDGVIPNLLAAAALLGAPRHQRPASQANRPPDAAADTPAGRIIPGPPLPRPKEAARVSSSTPSPVSG